MLGLHEIKISDRRFRITSNNYKRLVHDDCTLNIMVYVDRFALNVSVNV